MQTAKRLREEQGKAWTAMKALKETRDAREEGKQVFTKEEQEQFFKADEDYEKYEKLAIAEEKLEVREKEELERFAEKIDKDGPDKVHTDEEKNKIRDSAFKKYVMSYIPEGSRILAPEAFELTAEERKILAETRAQSVGTDTAGGHTTAPGFSGEFDKALKEFGGMMEASRIFRTATGSTFDWPTVDDTGKASSLLSENTASGELDVVWGNATFDAYKFTSGMVRISNELIQDSEFNFEAETAALLVERHGRGVNVEATGGSGSSRPQGVRGACAYGGTASVSSGLIYGDFTELKHAVDPAYRANARWMFNDTTLKSIKEMSVGSSDNRPLWIPGIAFGEPSTVDGDPYTINQDVPSYAAGNEFLLYGDFSKFVIRIVRDVQVMASTHRYFEVDQLALVAFMRFDSEILNSAAIKKMRAPST